MSGEAAHPRKNLKRAFKTIYWRFGVFFIGGALACGIVIPYNDAKLIAILASGGSATGTAASSPFVIAMQNLGIGVLPHITNALLVTSFPLSLSHALHPSFPFPFIFYRTHNLTPTSYCACRTLYGLSLDGHAPRFLRKCTRQGVPIYCFCITMIFPFLSFLAVGSSSGQVITWLANLTEASQIMDYICMCIIYLFFFRALRVQGVDRATLPYRGWGQPYCAWAGLIAMIFTVGCYGYTTFLPGFWDLGTFFSYYTMVFVCPVLYVFWKVFHRTQVIKPADVDLVWERPVIDAYEASVAETHLSFWTEVKIMMGWGKKDPHTLE
ncbi:general amino acid permease agp2 protein [Rutstroemia sp. NJR-2017a BBW]|nr:general amino acid permease agp2 protein [Rutstroemia sp. NJR-2017a BBW]PQE08642.1 general amino acid permease agp2 protein [Rutstroemia sp. NJR-2017a BBW]